MNKNDDKNSSSIKNKQEQEFKNFTCSFHFANNWQHELKIKAQVKIVT